MARFNSGGVGAALGGTPAPASPTPPADSDTDPNTFSRPQGPLAWGKFVFVVLGLLLIYWLVQHFLFDRLTHDFPRSHTHVPDQPIFWLVPGPVGWLVNLAFGVIAIWCLLTALPVTRRLTRKARRKLRSSGTKPAKRVWLWRVRRKLFAARTDPPKVLWSQLWWGLSLLPFTILAVIPGLNELGVVSFALWVAGLSLIIWKAWWSGARSAANHAKKAGNDNAKARCKVSMLYGLLAVVLLLVPTGHGWAFSIDNTSAPTDRGPDLAHYCAEYRGNPLACANGEAQRAQRAVANYTKLKKGCNGDTACLDQLRTDGTRENFKAEAFDACTKADTARGLLTIGQQASFDKTAGQSCGPKMKAFYESKPNTFDGDFE